MSELQRLLNDPRFRPTDRTKQESAGLPEAGLGSVLRVVSSMHEPTELSTPPTAPQDWDGLIHRVQAAARQRG